MAGRRVIEMTEEELRSLVAEVTAQSLLDAQLAHLDPELQTDELCNDLQKAGL